MRTYRYSDYGAVAFDTQAGVDIAIELATVGESAASVTALLNAAGVTSSAPVYGWIVAGALATAAGIMAFLGAAERHAMRVDMVAPIAEQYGFPEAIAFPEFVIDAMQGQRTAAWRKYQANKLEQDIASGKGEEWIHRAKLQFLGILEAFDLAQQRIAAGLPMAPPTEEEVERLEQSVQHTREATKITKKTRKLLIMGGATLAFVMIAYVIIDD